MPLLTSAPLSLIKPHSSPHIVIFPTLGVFFASSINRKPEWMKTLQVGSRRNH
jgi:hypothetical protein